MTKLLFVSVLSAFFLIGGFSPASACPGMGKDGVKCAKCAESEKKPCVKCKEGKHAEKKPCEKKMGEKKPCKVCKESERRSKNNGIFFNE